MNILTSMPFKQPDANGVVSGELPNGNVRNTSFNGRMTAPPSESTSIQTVRSAPFVTHGHEQSLSDPVQMMRMLSEKAQKQQASSSSNHPPTETPSVQMMRMLSEKAASYALVSRKCEEDDKGTYLTAGPIQIPAKLVLGMSLSSQLFPFPSLLFCNFYQVDDCWRRKVEEVEGIARGETRSAALEGERR
ncbi:hypothetical protein RYX36_002629 [Vicia faba]